MRTALLLIAVAVVGCGRSMTFEEAFAAGRIGWEPVDNVELTTIDGNTRTTTSVGFVTKISYDPNGKASPDTTGQKSYKWSDKEATFGPNAVIKLTKDAVVSERALKAGEQWTWTGQQWKAK